MKTVKALGLCSGGLDSILSAFVLREQGIHVEWITFETPFFSAENAIAASERYGVKLTTQKITPVYMKMLRNPPGGYGKHMNPCLDCHALMFKLAGQLMEKEGFNFLFSGEVAGQRPMSQTKPSLKYVEKHSGYAGLILRPLSAQNLPVTIPETANLVDREKLLNFSGRSRKPQIQLAKTFGVLHYPAPAGGCLLTDKGYSTRLKDLFEHKSEVSENELLLLKYGRHFRLNQSIKIIVGRSQKENEQIMSHSDPKTDTFLSVLAYPGPVALMPTTGTEEDMLLAASICAAYSKAPNNATVEVSIKIKNKETPVPVLSLPAGTFRKFLITS